MLDAIEKTAGTMIFPNSEGLTAGLMSYLDLQCVFRCFCQAFKTQSPINKFTRLLLMFLVIPAIQNSNFFIDDLQNAASLEDESYTPLPPGLTGL
jgi:hypothetical protein